MGLGADLQTTPPQPHASRHEQERAESGLEQAVAPAEECKKQGRQWAGAVTWSGVAPKLHEDLRPSNLGKHLFNHVTRVTRLDHPAAHSRKMKNIPKCPGETREPVTLVQQRRDRKDLCMAGGQVPWKHLSLWAPWGRHGQPTGHRARTERPVGSPWEDTHHHLTA